MIYYVGVDTGLKGGFCIIDSAGQVIEYGDIIPEEMEFIGPDADVHKSVIHGTEFIEYISEKYALEYIVGCIEEPLTVRDRTKVSIATLFSNFAIVKYMWGKTIGTPVILKPHDWQKVSVDAALYMNDKRVSKLPRNKRNSAAYMIMNSDTFPESVKNIDAVCDAYCIATAGMRVFTIKGLIE